MIMKSGKRSVIVLSAILVALVIVFMLDEVFFYLLFKHLFGWKPDLWGKIGIGALILLLNLWPALLVIKSFNEKPQTGPECMVGTTGTVRSSSPPFYWVMVRGELWRAHADENLAVGDGVIVRNLQGLTLHVTREHKNANGENA